VSFCVIDTKDIQQGDRFDIDVNCLSDCNYTIVAYFDRSYHMQVGEFIPIIATNDQQNFEVTINVNVTNYT
jgi:hypothetical protein